MVDEEEGKCIGAPFNIGIMYWRNTEMASRLGGAWGDAVMAAGRMDYMGEQARRPERDHSRPRVAEHDAPHPGSGHGGDAERLCGAVAADVGQRERRHAPGGQRCARPHVLPHQAAAAAQGVDVYAVHATFQHAKGRQGQFLGKRQRFREEGLWALDPPAHFTDGKFLTWSEELPLDFREPDSPGEGDLDFHLRVGGAAPHDCCAERSAPGVQAKARFGAAALHLFQRPVLDVHTAQVRHGHQRPEAIVILPPGPHLQPRDFLQGVGAPGGGGAQDGISGRLACSG